MIIDSSLSIVHFAFQYSLTEITNTCDQSHVLMRKYKFCKRDSFFNIIWKSVPYFLSE